MPTITVSDQAFTMNSGESVLDTLLRNGIRAPHTCRMAVCSRCLATLVSGEVPPRATQSLSEKQLEQKKFMVCVCFPDQDLEIEVKLSPSHPQDADHRY